MSLTKAQVKKIALSLPLTEEATSYGYPSFKTNGKFLTRLRSEDDSLVLYVSSTDERDHLIAMDPETFHVTPHYKDYPMVLARISKLDTKTLKHMLDLRWRQCVPKKMLRELGG